MEIIKNSVLHAKKPGTRAFSTVVIILMLSVATLTAVLPAAVAAKTTITVQTYLYPIIGQNSATMLSFLPSPNPLIDSAAYAKLTSAWNNATVTFTKPNGEIQVVNGPFKARFPVPGAATRRDLVLIYTPDQKGTWTVNFTWPGDDTYNAVSRVDTFPVGDAHPKRNMFAFLSMRPYPNIGLNQELLVNAWITPPPITARDTYENVQFTVKKPDGTTAYSWYQETEAPGVTWFQYYFDQLGNWSITMSWAGDFISKPCSITRYINVQQTPIAYPVADTPLPTNFWSFPINVYNREWRNIAGPWYQQYYNASRQSCNPYTEAPKTAHVLWRNDPVSGIGGYIGATDQYKGIETTGIYTSSALNIRTVMAGRGYYSASGMINCINMTNGQKLWSVPGSFSTGATRSRAPVLYYFAANTFTIFDAVTGAVSLNTTGMPMTLYDDPYVLTLDSSAARLIKWTTAGTSTNFASRIIWNTSLSQYAGIYNLAANWWYVIYDNIFAMRLSKYLAGLGGGTAPYESVIVHKIIAYNMTTGQQIYDSDIVDPTNPDTWWLQQGPCTGSAYGLFYFTITGNPQQMNPPTGAGGYVAFDIYTGKFKWLSEQFNYPWGDFFAYMPMGSGYGYIYSLGYDGVYALNVSNGKIVWHYTPGNSGMETPYNTWPFGSTGPVIGGGVIFAPETEHSPTLYYRGNALKAIDAYNGREVWDIMGYWVPTSIAFGTLLATESPSGFTYAFAKGRTATAVEVQNDVYTKGNAILIKGTVTDQSPAQPGTPAISDDSMTAWMEYIHMQQPKPTNATGVPVKLTAIDSSGKSTNLGTVWSDTSGLFKKLWTPTVEGEYTIVASFEGSNAYYASSAETVVGVGPAAPAASASPAPTESPSAPTPTPSPTASASTPAPTTPTPSPSTPSEVTPTPVPTQAPPPTQAPSMDIYIIVAAVVVIAVIAISALILRKRSK